MDKWSDWLGKKYGRTSDFNLEKAREEYAKYLGEPNAKWFRKRVLK